MNENMPNRCIDVQPGRKPVGMQVNAWRDVRGLIHVTRDGDGRFHGKPEARRERVWPLSTGAGARGPVQVKCELGKKKVGLASHAGIGGLRLPRLKRSQEQSGGRLSGSRNAPPARNDTPTGRSSYPVAECAPLPMTRPKPRL